MAIFEIKMPKLGESITEGTIILWSVKEGDSVNEDDVLFEVTTQKVSAEIPSPVSGKVSKLLVKEGETVAVGTVVALIETGNEIQEETTEKDVKEETTVLPEPEKNIPVEVVSTPGKMPEKEVDRWYSPIVHQIAKEAQISPEELDTILGTGYLGRLSKKDIEHYIEQKKKGKMPVPSVEFKPETQVESKMITPPAISVSPVKENEEIKDMDPVRRIIADHMVMSKKVSPHVTTIVEADVTNLVRWREKVKDEFFHREGVKLTYMPAITEACAKALIEFPQVNTSVDGYKIIFKKNINIGIAVSLDNGNLVVPVIKNADKLNVNGLATSIESLAVKARKNKLTTDNIEGGTFTITNFGTFRNIIGTPIINQPQVAILGVGYIEKKPAVIETSDGDMIAIRYKMYLSLSYDHRVVDGALGGAFVYRIAQYLENWNDLSFHA